MKKAPIPFEHSFAKLPANFYHLNPPRVPSSPKLLIYNEKLAQELGLPPELRSRAEVLLSGKQIPTQARTLSMAYAGHQFGHFVPQLGDGRAHLLGEILDPQSERWDIQLKGSGRSQFSRQGDGLAPLGPAIREYIMSECLYALGVPTSRVLCVVATGDPVYREQTLPGAVLTRVAKSHIRVGSFEFHAARGDRESLKLLFDFTVDRHFSHSIDPHDRVLSFFKEVTKAQARLIAHWMSIGFIHGVMNTDNVALSGQTIDFGPCAFMDQFEWAKTFSSIDRRGRYCYQNQPPIAQWNLARLADTLLFLESERQEELLSEFEKTIGNFTSEYQRELDQLFSKKFAITPDQEASKIIRDFLSFLEIHRLHYTQSFCALADVLRGKPNALDPIKEFTTWKEAWLKKIGRPQEQLQEVATQLELANPIVIAQNHLIEECIQKAHQGDDSDFLDLAQAICQPFHSPPHRPDFGLAPQPDQLVSATFCGT